jgi:hypothetical protein
MNGSVEASRIAHWEAVNKPVSNELLNGIAAADNP